MWDNTEDDAYAQLLKNEVILVRYPFSDLTAAKVRPAVGLVAPHPSKDILIVPLTSRIEGLQAGEFVLADWRTARLNLPSAVKRGLYTIHSSLVLKSVGRILRPDANRVDASLRVARACIRGTFRSCRLRLTQRFDAQFASGKLHRASAASCSADGESVDTLVE